MDANATQGVELKNPRAVDTLRNAERRKDLLPNNVTSDVAWSEGRSNSREAETTTNERKGKYR